MADDPLIRVKASNFIGALEKIHSLMPLIEHYQGAEKVITLGHVFNVLSRLQVTKNNLVSFDDILDGILYDSILLEK